MKLVNEPTKEGFFGEFGGMFVPEPLKKVLMEVAEGFEKYRNDKEFLEELDYYFNYFIGRPTPLYYAERISKDLGGAKIYLKREDLCHMGAHKLNNVIGQILLAKKLGKTRIIAETGAGQHGVATACAAAMFGLECVIYMGAVDVKRQHLNVFRMEMMGAKVVSVKEGQQTLKDAVDSALYDFVVTSEKTYYLVGSAVGPHPYPNMVKFFQSIIGREAREQIMKQEGRLPNYLIACCGGGSNAIGLFNDFLEDETVNLIGVESAGKGLDTHEHCATLTLGKPGVLHGAKCHLLTDEDGEVSLTHSISAGLDYPGVGPEHSYLKNIGRVDYQSVTDDETLSAFLYLSRKEGIIPALESSHALAYAIKLAPKLDKDKIIIVNLSGRGDKDVEQVSEMINFDDMN